MSGHRAGTMRAKLRRKSRVTNINYTSNINTDKNNNSNVINN